MERSGRSVQLGVDIGGTFTDLILFDAERGTFVAGKTLTTPPDPSTGAITGISDVLDAAEMPASAITQLVHGTTLITNALIERSGARTALITTAGFEDVIEIGREHRYDLYDIFLEMPPPLVPRRWRRGLNERILVDGTVDTPLSETDVLVLIDEFKSAGIEAVAVCLMHAYRFASHERRIRDLFAEHAPEIFISISSEVAPEIREYERTSTTLANVYVRPLADQYLNQLQTRVRETGITSELFIMLSSGGLSTVDTARRHPIRLVESGPAAGVLAAASYARVMGLDRVISFDMGGTTAKASIIDNGAPLRSNEFEVSRMYRFKKGSGLPIKVPVVEMIEIGAGGGSIARIDTLGLLKVGPESAGANPGPACYGRGEHATVTDADLLLGYLDPAFFLGGSMTLDRENAQRAVQSLAEPLGLTLTEAAWGIHQVVNENMASAARVHSIERGRDPRRYPVFAFGGAGPVHAYRVAEILGSPEVIIPPSAGVLSALGFLTAPLAFDFVRSYVGGLGEINPDEINQLFTDMENEGRTILGDAGLSEEMLTFYRTVDLRFAGQGHEVSVPVPSGDLDRESSDYITRAFETIYQQLYDRFPTGNRIEAVNWRVQVSGPEPDLPLNAFSGSHSTTSTTTDSALKGRRLVYQPESKSYAEVPVYDRYSLSAGAVIHGPTIIEERESTIVAGAESEISVDDMLNVRIVLPPRH